MAGPYVGAEVSDTFLHRWRFGGTHDSRTPPQQVGGARPQAKIEIRRGRFVRRYHAASEWAGPIFGDIAGGVPGLWYADWTPEEDWIEIGGLVDHRLEQSFQNNGVTAATITIDNTVMQEIAGVVGTFHKLMHGWFTPLRGYDPAGRPKAGIDRSPFFQKLPNAQIRLHTGYGDDQPTVFLGLIDDIETGNAPETAQITARDMGGPTLVDQHFFGWAKEPKITDPVIFMPRAEAEKREMRGGGAAASSETPGYPARGVVQSGSHNAWLSEGHTDDSVTEWVEIHVPAGRYRAIYVNASFDHELFIAVMAKPRGHNTKLLARWLPNSNESGAVLLDESYLDVQGYIPSPDGGPDKPFGWVKFNTDVVPGANGGFPYIAHRERATPGRGMRIPLGGELWLGADSVIRVGIRHLSQVDRSYKAGVLRLQAEARLLTTDARKGRYVLIDDVTQIVECIFRWAGFKDWEVETAGVDLKERYVVDKSKAFIDVVNDIKEMLGYSFFIGEPRDDADDQDLGWPIFRETRILNPNQSRTEQITEGDLLTQGRYKLSNEDERYIIRARGKALSRKKGGRWLSGDKTNRAMYVYRPPWVDQMAGIIKHLTHADPKMETIADCQQAALLIALQIALGKYTGTVAIPGTPHIGIDTAISLLDRTVGINSRFYISNRVQTFTGGEQAKYVTELGGGLADTPDVVAVAADYNHFIATTDRNDPR